MEKEVKHDISGFPSHFVSPAIKETKEYNIAWAEAALAAEARGESCSLFRNIKDEFDFSENRAFARGNQSIDQYKPILGVRKKTKRDPNYVSYKVLDWSILPILPKFVNLLVGRLLSQNNDVGVNAVDKNALDDRRKMRTNLQEYIINKPLLDSITAATGMQFSPPIQDGSVPPPEGLGQIDTYMQMFYKERYCVVLQDWLKILNEQDNYQEILKDIAYDLVEVRIAATKTYRVGRRIKRRRCIPERMRVGACQKDNFEDAPWVYEEWDLTIGELKEIAGGQFTEEEYKDIAEKATGISWGSVDYRDPMYQLGYPWDKSKVTIQDMVYFSPNDNIYQVKKTNYGNVSVYDKDFDWWADLRSKGVDEKKFNENNENKVIIQPTNDQYQIMWIRKTKYAFNYGKSKDMLKNESDIGTVIGPYCIQSLKDCIVSLAKPIVNNIQINWLQYQHHAAKSRPAGLSIEIGALQDISLSGAAGETLTPKQVLELYFDTGIQLWKIKDASGRVMNKPPVAELGGGISEAMVQHWQNIVNGIDLLKAQIGENDLTDASTPSGEIGKAIGAMAVGNMRDAQKFLHFGYDQLNIGTHKRTVMHISGMAANGLAPDYTQALGEDAVALTALMSDIGFHEYGYYLQKQATPEMKAMLQGFCNNGITAGSLYEEEAFEIMNEPNIFRAIDLLKQYRQQKLKQKQQESVSVAQAQADATADAGIRLEKEKQNTIQMQAKLTGDSEWNKARAEVWKSKQVLSDEAFLVNLKSQLARGEAITEEQQRRITELEKANVQGQYQLRAAAARPEPAAA